MAQDREKLRNSIISIVNKSVGDSAGKVAYLLSEDEFCPSDVTGWISTGSDMLDLIISNTPNGGIPIGKIIELQGAEGSGKSLIGAHILRETQRQGGFAIYIDTENAINRDFLRVIGVDLSELILIEMNVLEEIYQTIENIILNIRKQDKKVPVTILLDSMAGTTTESESESDFGRDGFATSKALINGKAMRKLNGLVGKEQVTLVITNQLREVPGVMIGDKETTPGGKAVGYHSSVRVRFYKATKIKDKKTKEVIGLHIQAKTLKNRMAPPYRGIDFILYFTSGIDNYTSWLLKLKEYGCISGSNIVIGEKKIPYTTSTFAKEMEGNPELRKEIYDLLADKIVMKYKTQTDENMDDVDITDEDIDS